MTGRLLTRRLVPALVAVLTLGIGGVAQASTVSVKNDELLIDDSVGESNVLTYWRESDANGHQVIYVHQATGPTDLPQDYPQAFPPPPAGVPILPDLLNGCTNMGQEEGTVKCTSTNATFKAIKATLGGKSDYISNVSRPSSILLDPTTAVTLDGGADDDALFGSTNGDTIIGGTGNDDLRGNGGDDVLRPGDGQDSIRGGANGAAGDTVDFSTADRSKRNAVTAVSLDGIPNDGALCTTAKNPVPSTCDASNVFGDVENITTGDGDDAILANDSVNVIKTNGGNDVVTALGGDDNVQLGEGANTALGGDGADTITSGAGIDTIDGENGNDNVSAGAGNNKLTGGLGNDTLTALGGDDTIDGNDGNDTINAGAGANTLNGGAGDDGITSTTGNDTVTGGTGNDIIAAGDGTNTVVSGPAALASGDTDADQVTTGSGNDTIDAGAGDDLVHAGDGANTTNLGDGNDGKATDPLLTGGTGVDLITGGNGDDYIKAGAGDNVVTGDAGADKIFTLGGDDKVLGGTGADEIHTDLGNDYLQGGPEANVADVLDAGGETMGRQSRQFSAEPGLPSAAFQGDTVDYSDRTGAVYAQVGTSNNSGENCPGPTCEADSITSAENLIGGAGNDTLKGDDAHANTLDGRDGSDVLDGMAGDDVLLGGKGDDSQLLGGSGGDYISGGDGIDSVSYITATVAVSVTLDGAAGDGTNCPRPDKTVSGTCENDNLQGDLENIEGSNYDDYLSGSDGRNDLYGRNGDDVLVGNGGPDVLQGDGGVDTVLYTGRVDDLTITAYDNVANDGGSNEGDNVKSTVENITGGDGNDIIVATNDPVSSTNTIRRRQGQRHHRRPAAVPTTCTAATATTPRRTVASRATRPWARARPPSSSRSPSTTSPTTGPRWPSAPVHGERQHPLRHREHHGVAPSSDFFEGSTDAERPRRRWRQRQLFGLQEQRHAHRRRRRRLPRRRRGRRLLIRRAPVADIVSGGVGHRHRRLLRADRRGHASRSTTSSTTARPTRTTTCTPTSRTTASPATPSTMPPTSGGRLGRRRQRWRPAAGT